MVLWRAEHREWKHFSITTFFIFIASSIACFSHLFILSFLYFSVVQAHLAWPIPNTNLFPSFIHSHKRVSEPCCKNIISLIWKFMLSIIVCFYQSVWWFSSSSVSMTFPLSDTLSLLPISIYASPALQIILYTWNQIRRNSSDLR